MLRVGTDCSGIEAPLQALINLKIPFSHEFSSEVDSHCVQSIRANYNPKAIFTDITNRRIQNVPDIDLYVCGFPCQPFSSAGKRRGAFDLRGTLFYSCLEVISHKRPKYFVLENVKGLLTIHGGTYFKHIIASLAKIGTYNIYWKVLNTKDYGIPQNRERLFIVGTTREFDWPLGVACKNVQSFIDKYDTQEEAAPNYMLQHDTFERLPPHAAFINIEFPQSSFLNTDKICPCILARSSLWCVPFHRRANTKEYLKLQGFPVSFKQVVSDTQLKKQVGNSMSVCVLEAIFRSLLNS